MPFKKLGKDRYQGPTGKIFNRNQVRLYYSLGGHFPGQKTEDCAPPTNNMGSGHISGAIEKAPILFRKLKKVLRRKRNNIHEGSERDPFITDMGKEFPVTDTKTGKEVMRLKRYGVWAWDQARRRHQVVDTGNDLEQLRKKHGVHPSRFAVLKGTTQESTGFPRKPFSWHYFNKKKKKGFDDPNAAGADGNGT